ncbi:NADH dehydrogenase [ubiquinone] 1 beta subcomplex subunit 3 [Nasonia vitripennis]|uniref:Complex I-B12 n=1 Tax=Nasonia vitripennis TaxID=7425 RepID=A0A7M6UDE5_NASVI|nr:NADH dehydrogenase [ubiquinone] 1 beta subcomplex subunit 3 [Nasonia vitripennis]
MGGHHHVKLPNVPDPSIYKVEDAKDLLKVQERLAKKGLKDPWMRNYVWRCTIDKADKHPNWVLLKFFTYGWKYWVPLVGLTIGIEHFLGIDYHAHGHGHGHDDKHEAHH